MSSQDVDTGPIQISIPASIIHFRVPLSEYLSDNPSYTNLAVGACIFSRQEPPRLLLVQRAATERGFPNRWEVPGGSVDAADPTILHGLAREVFEETGLKLTRYVCQVGQGIMFTTGPRGRWMKLSFEIEVQGGADQLALMGRLMVALTQGRWRRQNAGCIELANCLTEWTEITLDPAEHQAYKWVTKEDVNEWGRGEIVSMEQREMMLLAFENHGDLEREQNSH